MASNHIAQGLRLLKSPNVNRLFVAYLVTYTGTAMAPIAMAFGVLELTGSAADAAFVIAAPTAAAIVVLLLGGVIADRTSRQRVIVLAELTAMAAQCTIAWLFLSGNATVPLLTLGMLVNGMAMALHAPAAMGMITQLVLKAKLQSTNALLGIARNSAFAGGAALGGVLVATLGAGFTLLIDGLSFGLSAFLILSLRPVAQEKTEPQSVLQDLRLGWREFTRHTWLWAMVLQFSLIVAAGEAVFGLLGPAVSRDHMGGATDWGFIASAHDRHLAWWIDWHAAAATTPRVCGHFLCLVFCLGAPCASRTADRGPCRDCRRHHWAHWANFRCVLVHDAAAKSAREHALSRRGLRSSGVYRLGPLGDRDIRHALRNAGASLDPIDRRGFSYCANPAGFNRARRAADDAGL